MSYPEMANFYITLGLFGLNLYLHNTNKAAFIPFPSPVATLRYTTACNSIHPSYEALSKQLRQYPEVRFPTAIRGYPDEMAGPSRGATRARRVLAESDSSDGDTTGDRQVNSLQDDDSRGPQSPIGNASRQQDAPPDGANRMRQGARAAAQFQLNRRQARRDSSIPQALLRRPAAEGIDALPQEISVAAVKSESTSPQPIKQERDSDDDATAERGLRAGRRRAYGREEDSEPTAPMHEHDQVRSSVSIMRRHLLATTPAPDQRDFLNRVFGQTRASDNDSEDGLFVRDDDVSSTMLDDDDGDDEDGRDIKELSQEAYEAFLVLSQAFKERAAAGLVGWKDQAQWQVIQDDYVRDYNKRRLDKVVGKEETRNARAIADVRRDQRMLIAKINDYRQLNVRQDVEASRGTKKRKSESASPEEETAKNKKSRPRQSAFVRSAWLPESLNELRGSIEVDWDPERPSACVPMSAEAQDSEESPVRECIDGAAAAQAPRQQVSADADSEDDSLLDPQFLCEDSSKALTRIVTHALEKAPEAKERMKNDKSALIDAKKRFRYGNKPTAIKGTDRFKVPRMRSTLRAYQVVGVGWMRWRELSADEPRGGLLCDAMGLGKTVQMLGVITDGKPDKSSVKDGHRSTLIVCSASLIDQWEEEIWKHCEKKWIGKVTRYKSTDFAKTTSDPLEQLQSFDIIITTYEEVMKSYPFAEYPIELKTADEKNKWWKKHFQENKGLLHSVHFHRFVIDECHRVKNSAGKAYEAVQALKATHRWLMSGTPVMDDTKELFAYFKIMHRQFMGRRQTFKKNFLDPLDLDHQQRLNYSLHNFVYRRTHKDTFLGKPILELPPAKEVRMSCTLSKFENAVYREIVHRYSLLIEKADDDKRKTFEHIFHMMTALQQLNSHPLLVQKEFARMSEAKLDELQAIYEEEACLNYKENLMFMQEVHKIDPAAGLGARYGKFPDFQLYRNALVKDKEAARPVLSCSWCKKTPAISRVIPCNHVLCKNCAEELRTDVNHPSIRATCDAARCRAVVDRIEDLDDDAIVALNPEVRSSKKGEKAKKDGKKGKGGKRKADDGQAPDLTGTWLNISGVPMPSSKMIAVKLKVLEWLAKDPGAKIIIFTHYLQMLYNLKRLCAVEDWEYLEFSGNIPPAQRTTNRQDFNNREGPCILLATIKSGNVGLNLTAASRAIIIEPWWNDSVDKQAFARIWRMGQERRTECVRLYMRGTIDDRKIKISDGKTKRIMKLAMKGELNDMTVEELVRLFKPAETDEEKENGGFILENDTQVPDHILKSRDQMSESTSDTSSTSTGYDSDDSDSTEDLESEDEGRQRASGSR